MIKIADAVRNFASSFVYAVFQNPYNPDLMRRNHELPPSQSYETKGQQLADSFLLTIEQGRHVGVTLDLRLLKPLSDKPSLAPREFTLEIGVLKDGARHDRILIGEVPGYDHTKTMTDDQLKQRIATALRDNDDKITEIVVDAFPAMKRAVRGATIVPPPY